MAILEVNQVSKSYGQFKAVDHISFKVDRGRIFGVLGPNGAGKTTTIRMILNILLPDSGEVKLFGRQMNDELKSRIGYLPEERGLYTKMKVIDMLIFLGRLHNMRPVDATHEADTWLQKLELSEWRNKKIEELSKGMQQKVQFIGTVIHDPELIILDEPFAGLDPINIQLIKEIMLDLKEKNKAIIFSTHLLDAAEKLSDDILLINQGQNVLHGSLKSIKEKHGKNAVQVEYQGDISFIKSHPMVEIFNDYGQYVEIVLNKTGDPNELLKVLVEKIKIQRFEYASSSLNEIFMDTIRREKNV